MQVPHSYRTLLVPPLAAAKMIESAANYAISVSKESEVFRQ